MNARGHIDEVRFVDPLARKMDIAGTGRIPAGSSIYLRGWAFLVGAPPRAANAALATIDDGEPFELAANQARPDVVKALGLPATLATIGFHGVRSLAGLSLGSHVLRIALVEHPVATTVTLDENVAFEIVDGAYAFTPTERLARGEMTVAVDAFTATGQRDGMDATLAPIARGAVLTVRGWAIDRRFTTAASDVYACIDGSTLVRGIIGTMRTDVSGSLGIGAVARCGYVVRIDTAALQPGTHALELRAVAADGARYATSDTLAFAIA